MAYTHEGPALYLTADRSQVVEEGDPNAAFLLVAEGGQLPDEEAARYGLTNKGKGKPAPAEVEEKAAAPAVENKSKQAPTNKSKG